MTIEERDTARAIQTIAKEIRKPKEIDWEQRRYELVRDFYLKWVSDEDLSNEHIMIGLIVKVEKAADILICHLKGK